MRDRKYDGDGRWRNLTVAFRVSPEEKDEINMRARLSGLNKQDYAINCCLGKSVIVNGNPRVYKALKTEMDHIRQELSRLTSGMEITDELWSRIDMVKVIYEGMKEDPDARGEHE